MYLGIDLGTSEIKTTLVDDAQRVVGSAGVKLTLSNPRPQWSEQDPEAWFDGLRGALAALRQAEPAALTAVRGLAISGQMHGAVLMDAEHRVLRPAILWNDTRSFAECAELETAVPASRAITGNLMMPGFTAPKLVWLRKHEPALFERIAKVLLPKDWLVWRLTGEFASEMSDAAGTMWLDVGRRDWSDALLAACGVTRAHMPRLVEGNQAVGMLRVELAREWGLGGLTEGVGVVVAAGAADNAAAGIGVGAVDSGGALVSLGSSGVIFVATDRFAPNPAGGVHAFCHAVPGRWFQMTVTLSATTSLSWATRLCGAAGEAEFAARAVGVEVETAPIFLPYLNGERTPHNDAAAKGVFFGLGPRTDAAALAYAVMEGVAFSLADCHASLVAAGTRVERATVVGGGARSRFWTELVAAISGIALDRPAAGDLGAAFGAARLARLAVTGEAVEAVCTRGAAESSVEPDARLRERLQPRYERYRRLYTALRDEFR